jgi:2-polyprenyl-3-methyl-5-hydroxy-6-metoxy-1,4-benzoquinol methylase
MSETSEIKQTFFPEFIPRKRGQWKQLVTGEVMAFWPDTPEADIEAMCNDILDPTNPLRIVYNEEYDSDPDNFYQTSKAFLMANQAFDLFNMGFDSLKLVHRYAQKGGQSCIDYGGGTGNALIVASQFIKDLHYLDLEGIMQEFATYRFEQRDLDVTFYDANPTGVTPIQSCDLVICTEVLEHVPFALELTEVLARAVNPGGYLILSYTFGTADTNATHLDIYNRGTGRKVLKILRKHGLELVEKTFKGSVKVFHKEELPEWAKGE